MHHQHLYLEQKIAENYKNICINIFKKKLIFILFCRVEVIEEKLLLNIFFTMWENFPLLSENL